MICIHCGQQIEPVEGWEYYKYYEPGTPDHERRRIHSRCVAALTREALRLMAAVPDDQRGIELDLAD